MMSNRSAVLAASIGILFNRGDKLLTSCGSGTLYWQKLAGQSRLPFELWQAGGGFS
jgi:hypothetical protein